jgi:hypothetical protein
VIVRHGGEAKKAEFENNGMPVMIELILLTYSKIQYYEKEYVNRDIQYKNNQ